MLRHAMPCGAILQARAANERGDYTQARAHFLSANARRPSVPLALSAANMALKAGDVGAAASEYQALQSQELSAQQRAVLERKLQETKELQRGGGWGF
jgi:uncharacterized protein HemY